MKKWQVVLGGAALAILLFAANTAQAAGYFIFGFKLTSYQQDAVGLNDPEGSFIYKNIAIKNKITTTSMLTALAVASGCPTPLAPGTMLGLYIDTIANPDHGQIFFLNADKTRLVGCDPISTEILLMDPYTDYQVQDSTLVDIPSGSEKGTLWYQIIYQFRLAPDTGFDLDGLASEKFINSAITGLKKTVKVNVHGRGGVGGKAAILFGSISAIYTPAP